MQPITINSLTDDYKQRRKDRKKRMDYMQKISDNKKLQNKQAENIENVIQQQRNNTTENSEKFMETNNGIRNANQ